MAAGESGDERPDCRPADDKPDIIESRALPFTMVTDERRGSIWRTTGSATIYVCTHQGKKNMHKYLICISTSINIDTSFEV